MTIMEIPPSLCPDYCITPSSLPAYAIQFAYDCRLCIESPHLMDLVMLMGGDDFYQKNNKMDLYTSDFIIILLSHSLRWHMNTEDRTSSLGCAIRMQQSLKLHII